MAFLKPVAEHFRAYLIETTNGTEVVPVDVCGELGSAEEAQQYCEGDVFPGDAYDVVEGWWARLSASGYLDCTDWCGPHATADDALAEVMAVYDVDADGESIE